MNKLAYYQGYMDKEALLSQALSKKNALLKALRARRAAAASLKGLRRTAVGKQYLKDVADHSPMAVAAFALPGGAALAPVAPAVAGAVQRKAPGVYDKLLQTAQAVGRSGVF